MKVIELAEKANSNETMPKHIRYSDEDLYKFEVNRLLHKYEFYTNSNGEPFTFNHEYKDYYVVDLKQSTCENFFVISF